MEAVSAGSKTVELHNANGPAKKRVMPMDFPSAPSTNPAYFFCLNDFKVYSLPLKRLQNENL